MKNHIKFFVIIFMFIFFFALYGVVPSCASAQLKEGSCRIELKNVGEIYGNLLTLRQYLRALDHSEFSVLELALLGGLMEDVDIAIEATMRIYEPMVYFKNNCNDLNSSKRLMLLLFISDVGQDIMPLLKTVFGETSAMINEESDVFSSEKNIFLPQYDVLNDALERLMFTLER